MWRGARMSTRRAFQPLAAAFIVSLWCAILTAACAQHASTPSETNGAPAERGERRGVWKRAQPRRWIGAIAAEGTATSEILIAQRMWSAR